MADPRIPSHRLDLTYPADWARDDEHVEAFNAWANRQIVLEAAKLLVAGERQWMEVWYFNVPDRPDTTAADFDAVEVGGDGAILTLPEYTELLA